MQNDFYQLGLHLILFEEQLVFGGRLHKEKLLDVQKNPGIIQKLKDLKVHIRIEKG